MDEWEWMFVMYLLTGLYLGILFFCVTRPPMKALCDKLFIGGILLAFWVCAWPVAIGWLLKDLKG